MQGRIAKGLHILKVNSAAVQSCENLHFRYIDMLLRAAMLLGIALGRDGKLLPRKLGWRDLALSLSVKPFALRWAEGLLRECEACPLWQHGGTFQAQVQIGLGRIHKAAQYRPGTAVPRDGEAVCRGGRSAGHRQACDEARQPSLRCSVSQSVLVPTSGARHK